MVRPHSMWPNPLYQRGRGTEWWSVAPYNVAAAAGGKLYVTKGGGHGRSSMGSAVQCTTPPWTRGPRWRAWCADQKNPYSWAPVKLISTAEVFSRSRMVPHLHVTFCFFIQMVPTLVNSSVPRLDLKMAVCLRRAYIPGNFFGSAFRVWWIWKRRLSSFQPVSFESGPIPSSIASYLRRSFLSSFTKPVPPLTKYPFLHYVLPALFIHSLATFLDLTIWLYALRLWTWNHNVRRHRVVEGRFV